MAASYELSLAVIIRMAKSTLVAGRIFINGFLNHDNLNNESWLGFKKYSCINVRKLLHLVKMFPFLPILFCNSSTLSKENDNVQHVLAKSVVTRLQPNLTQLEKKFNCGACWRHYGTIRLYQLRLHPSCSWVLWLCW